MAKDSEMCARMRFQIEYKKRVEKVRGNEQNKLNE